MVRKKSVPVRNLRNNTLQILTERVESLERERIERENSSVICLEVPNTDDDDGVVEERRRRGGRRRHVCEVCDKDFASKQSLENHKRIQIWHWFIKTQENSEALENINMHIHIDNNRREIHRKLYIVKLTLNEEKTFPSAPVITRSQIK